MVNKNKAPITIINSNLEDIRHGNLISVQAIPSQNENCLKNNTSRGSVKEVLLALDLVDILEIKLKIGAFIKALSINSLFNPARLKYRPDDSLTPGLLDLRELFETIAVVEEVNNIKENLEFVKKNFKMISQEEKSADKSSEMLAANKK